MELLVFITLMIAAVLFAVATFNATVRWNLVAAGLFFLTLGFLLPATQSL